MATIDDIGGATDSLGSVPLGGPNGWAAAVRDAINGKVDLAGGTMTGLLTAAGLRATAQGQTVRIGSVAAGSPILGVLNADASAFIPVQCADPAHPEHAATKRYVDGLVALLAEVAGVDLPEGWNE